MNNIIIHEVGMRDGLQMEKQTVPLQKKIEWIRRLIESDVDIIQLGSFVRADKVPQMADTDMLFEVFFRPENKPARTILSALVLNEKGLDRAIECGVEMICMGVSASETHSRKNTGMSIDDATRRILAMAQTASKAGKKVQLSVQSAFGCGYEGAVSQERVMNIVAQYRNAGFRSISLPDTAGHATPKDVEKMFGEILGGDDPVECACHFHNTYGLAIANCCAAMNVGVTTFESSVGGLGGCPFTKIAGGNTCTEDFVHALHRMDLRNDIDLHALVEVAQNVSTFFGRELPGTIYKLGTVDQELFLSGIP